jgi:hypothetical protein
MNVNAQCPGGCGLFNCSGICGFVFRTNKVWQVTLAAPSHSTPAAAAPLQRFDLVQVKSRSSGGASITNCHFHDAYDGVMQLRSGGATVRDNLFERSHAMSVSTAKSWLEGAAGLTGVVVAGNEFRGCCTPKAEGAQATCNPIAFHGCTNCTQANNTVVNQ